MQIDHHLLSPRYRDDGQPSVPLDARARQAVADVKARLARNSEADRAVLAHCPLCHGQAFIQLAEKDRCGLPLPLVICRGCGLVTTARPLTEAFATWYYPGPAVPMRLRGRDPEQDFHRRTAPGALAWNRHTWVCRLVGAPPAIVVEIGCADGCNLLPYHRNGARVLGFDFSESVLNAGRPAGMDLRRGGLDEALAAGVQADLLIVSHLIAHLHDPWSFLQAARALLKPDGHVFVETPGLDGCVRRLAECRVEDGLQPSNDLLGLIQFEMNHYFDQTTLAWSGQVSGLRQIAGTAMGRALFALDEPRALTIDEPRGEAACRRLRAVEADFRRREWWKAPVRPFARALRNALKRLR